MEHELIRQTMATKGWSVIEGMIKDKIVDLRLARNTNIKKSNDEIATDVKAKAKAANKLLSLLSTLNNINNAKEIKKENYI